MLQIIKDSRLFFICLGIYFVGGASILLILEKGDVELLFNGYHDEFLDIFFSWITLFGEGLIPLGIIFILLIRKVYFGISAGICLLISTIISQGLKRLVFEDTLRPKLYFKDMKDLYYIDGLEIHSYFSFPSGHTSGAFTLFCFLALINKNRYSDVICFFVAFFVGMSRMYLMQHFFIDTYFGALIGVVVTLVAFYYLEEHTQWKQRLNRPLINFNKQPAK